MIYDPVWSRSRLCQEAEEKRRQEEQAHHEATLAASQPAATRRGFQAALASSARPRQPLPSQEAVLVTLLTFPEPVTASQVAEATGSDLRQLSHVLGKLVRAGLATRTMHRHKNHYAAA